MTWLLDVNVLMALLWEDHVHYLRAVAWLEKVERFATCPLVQLGVVRVSSNPAFGYVASPDDAFTALRQLLSDQRHRFVPDDLGADHRELRTDQIASIGQITDFYLAALARRHGICLATFDVALHRAFLGEPGLIELVE